MMTAHSAPAPSWIDGLVDILQARRRAWLTAAVAVVLVAALIALLWPALLPPNVIVGLVVGIAGVLLATALVVALDSADLVVRGPRHIAAAGGTVACTISRSPADVDALMKLVDRHTGTDGEVRVALTPASRTAGVPGARANMVAEELARRDHKVLCTDLTRGRTPAVGLSDVLSGDRKLADAVRFDDDLYLAHLAIGSEPDVALAGFADWATSLPSDLDVLVAALPPLAEPGVLPAIQGVELVLVLVEVDRTERVDLIASLDAIDAAGVPAHLVLVDPDLDQEEEERSTTVAVLDHVPATDELDNEVVGSRDAPPARREPVEPREPAAGAASVPGGVAAEAAATGATVVSSDGTDVERGPAPTTDSGQQHDSKDMAAKPQPNDDDDPHGDDVRRVDAAAGADQHEPVDAGQDEAAHHGDDETAVQGYDDDEDEVVPPVALGGGHVRTVRARPTAGQAGEPVADSDRPTDDIDETAREAARLTSSLHDLAAQVWDRDDEQDTE